MVRDYEALTSFIAGRAAMPFEWGRTKNDCVSFAAGAIRAQTRRDVLRGAPRWSTKTGALRLAVSMGGMAAIVTGRLADVPPALAHRGDIAGVIDPSFPGGLALMVIEGEFLIGPGEHGTERRHRSMMVRAWSAV